jgi:hypothetical protein
MHDEPAQGGLAAATLAHKAKGFAFPDTAGKIVNGF